MQAGPPYERPLRLRGRAFAAAALAAVVLTTGGVTLAQQTSETFDPEAKLAALGLKLGASARPMANYLQAVRTGNLVVLAGHGPELPSGGFVTGKVGRDLTREKLVTALETTQQDLGGFRVGYAPDSRIGSNFVELTVIVSPPAGVSRSLIPTPKLALVSS